MYQQRFCRWTDDISNPLHQCAADTHFRSCAMFVICSTRSWCAARSLSNAKCFLITACSHRHSWYVNGTLITACSHRHSWYINVTLITACSHRHSWYVNVTVHYNYTNINDTEKLVNFLYNKNRQQIFNLQWCSPIHGFYSTRVESSNYCKSDELMSDCATEAYEIRRRVK